MYLTLCEKEITPEGRYHPLFSPKVIWDMLVKDVWRIFVATDPNFNPECKAVYADSSTGLLYPRNAFARRSYSLN
jgi:hypothetical protein